MKRGLLAFLLMMTVCLPASAFADAPMKNETVQSCDASQTITHEEAAALLGVDANSIAGIVPGPFQGVWEVNITVNGKVHLIYVDCSKKFFIQGHIFRLSNKENLTRARFEELNPVDVSSIPLNNAIVLGKQSSNKRIIVFTDPTCTFCVKLHGAIKEAIRKDPEAAFYIMPYPRNSADKALYEKCQAALCDKSGKILDDIYAGKEVGPPTCKSNAVDEIIRLVERLQIQGTPSMVLPDGRVTSGYRNAEDILKLLK
ncbi:MAG: DsbC family protein [Syntrophorhabdaceae bacterium]|nr:DsbC family protein [Syntrophorhabdaceae bacterium]